MRRAERPERHRAVTDGVRLRRGRNGGPDGVDHAPRVGLQVGPGPGRADAARLAGEERLPDGLLQALDLLGDGRLGHAEGIGGCGERAGLERRDEALELRERQVHGDRATQELLVVTAGNTTYHVVSAGRRLPSWTTTTRRPRPAATASSAPARPGSRRCGRSSTPATTFDCFEATDRIGGHWHTDYDCLHLITPRDGSGFRATRCPRAGPTSLAGPDARVPRRPRRPVRPAIAGDVRDARRAADAGRPERAIDGWDVTTSDGQTRRYAGVLVANGHNSVPVDPVGAGDVHRQDAPLRRVPEPGRHRGPPRPRRRIGQLRLRHRLGARPGGLRHRAQRPPGPPVPAEDVLREAARLAAR